jgi:hypothetical protein
MFVIYVKEGPMIIDRGRIRACEQFLGGLA